MKKHIITILSAAALTLTSCSKAPAPEESSTERQPESTAAETETVTEPEEDITLTMACFIPTGIDDYEADLTAAAMQSPFFLAVKDFNDNHEHIDIELKNYYEYYDTNLAEHPAGLSEQAAAPAVRQLIVDMMSGGIIDILPLNAIPDRGGTFEMLAAKGAFTDLYALMAEDSEINTDTLNAHVLSLFENEGELPYLITDYCIETLAGEEKYVGTEPGWTFDEFAEKWSKMPEGSVIDGHNTRDYVYFTVLRSNISAFMDYRKGTCSFDSPEFIRMLDFIGTFDTSLNYKPDINYEAPNFLDAVTVRGFQSYHDSITAPLLSEPGTYSPCTLVGYPSDDGSGSFISANGSIGICRSSSPEKQRAAWQFLRELVSEDSLYEAYFQNSSSWSETDEDGEVYDYIYTEEAGFPINNAAFERCADDIYSRGEKGEPHFIHHYDGKMDIGWPSRSEYDDITAFIDSISRSSSRLDTELWDIMEDEMSKFCHGESTSEETAAILQNRISLLVSEKT